LPAAPAHEPLVAPVTASHEPPVAPVTTAHEPSVAPVARLVCLAADWIEINEDSNGTIYLKNKSLKYVQNQPKKLLDATLAYYNRVKAIVDKAEDFLLLKRECGSSIVEVLKLIYDTAGTGGFGNWLDSLHTSYRALETKWNSLNIMIGISGVKEYRPT
jgi:hypothetical protein